MKRFKSVREDVSDKRTIKELRKIIEDLEKEGFYGLKRKMKITVNEDD